ncbi:amidohydrolase family protein [Congregibacter sp.]|uniref:amidohydrolase family protein n=1 Tax=Congregibacter sp. TaxID=2744308 RepID=UPI00385FAA84
MRSQLKLALSLAQTALLSCAVSVSAQDDTATQTLFKNVNVFDGFADELAMNTDVLIEGNHIVEVAKNISAPDATVIDGGGRTLTPGLIDMHTHVTFETTAGTNGFNEYDFGGAGAMGAQALRDNMLMRGITTARDIAGNSRGMARLIQRGQLVGPRLYTSGGVLSPTGGHGDWGGPTDTKRNLDYGAMVEQSFIIEGRESVIEASRRNFRNGAHFTKVMAGGGVASLYDPLEILSATQDEVEAAVEIASEYGTYVAVHAYTDASYNRSLDAGVRSFEHGFLVSEDIVKKMAKKKQDIAWSFQCFMSVATFGDYDSMPGFFTHEQKLKGVAVGKGAKNAAALMLKHDVFMIGGSDMFTPTFGPRMKEDITCRTSMVGYPAAQALKMSTGNAGIVLKWSDVLDPYPTYELGTIRPNAYADILLWDGNPLDNIDLILDESKLSLIMKDGVIYKDIM